MPTLDVASCPVNPTVIGVGDMVPTADVALTPVNGTPIPTVKDPTEDVAETPVGITPIPTVKLPTEVVACCPVGCSVRASRIIPPTVDVALTPVSPIVISVGESNPTFDVTL